jgi:hypothetical protein
MNLATLVKLCKTAIRLGKRLVFGMISSKPNNIFAPNK